MAGYAGLALFAAGYVVALSLTRVGSRRYWCIAIAMALLTAGEAVIAHEDALVMCVFLAVLLMAGLVLDGRNAEAAAGVAVLTTVSAFVPALVPSWDTGPDWDMLVVLPLVSLAMWGFFHIVRSHRELTRGPRRAGPARSPRERLRFARDLHDLLGHSLSLIALKSELAGRLAERDPARARRRWPTSSPRRSALAEVRDAAPATARSASRRRWPRRGRPCGRRHHAAPPPRGGRARRGRRGPRLGRARGHDQRAAAQRRPGVTVELDGRRARHADGVRRRAGRRRDSGRGGNGLTERVAALGGRLEAGTGGPGIRLAARGCGRTAATAEPVACR